MAKDQLRTPMSQGGLVRYSEGVKSKIEISPKHVVLLCIIVGILLIALNMMG